MDYENEPRRSKRSQKKKINYSDEVRLLNIPRPLGPRLWSRTEKSKLLQALELYDDSDFVSMAAFIKTKSAQQVDTYIKSVRKKADMLSRRSPSVVELEKWTKLLDKASKNEDVSHNKYDHLMMPLLLISLFEEFPTPPYCEGIDFKSAYKFIFCIMAEITPPSPNQKTMEFISKTFSEMGLMITQNSDLKNYVIKKLDKNASDVTEALKDIFNPLSFPKMTVPLSMRNYDNN